MEVVEDPEAPGGRRLIFRGALDNVVDFMSRSMNFKYRYVRSVERTFGSKKSDGSWSGMVGMVVREHDVVTHLQETDFATGLFIMTPSRAEVVDFSWRLWTNDIRLLGARGRPEVDPWGFLLPLAPLVWMAVLTSLAVAPAIPLVLMKCVTHKAPGEGRSLTDMFNFIRVLLQQDIAEEGGSSWSWERLVLGVWMMMTLVLTRSYAGNLMSLLAVRHIPQPYHTLRDVLDDPSVIMIWQKNSAQAQYLRSVQSGTFREIADLESRDRLRFHTPAQFKESIDTLLRKGDYVFAEPATTLRNLIVQDFSRTGRCDFYISRDGFLPYSASMISQKNSPILHAISKRVRTLAESGLYRYWVVDMKPNVSYCRHPPRKITVSTSLSATNLWGMFVVLVCGYAVATFLLCLEVITAWSKSRQRH
ncbi:glutamate receptor ionotropic, delta-1-like [Panulirus ornatus]|uniref:glutamate receptor ionotropic, delta-1-like n=1 Tax=Panulirus ornatus TaxID=150431 RepID=UPI003A896618